MHRFTILTTLFAATTIIAPRAVQADERADKHREMRYYDRSGKDYHAWNDHEDHAYRIYLDERHRDYLEFSRAHDGEQQDYFLWRHEHPDDVIFKSEIR